MHKDDLIDAEELETLTKLGYILLLLAGWYISRNIIKEKSSKMIFFSSMMHCYFRYRYSSLNSIRKHRFQF